MKKSKLSQFKRNSGQITVITLFCLNCRKSFETLYLYIEIAQLAHHSWVENSTLLGFDPLSWVWPLASHRCAIMLTRRSTFCWSTTIYVVANHSCPLLWNYDKISGEKVDYSAYPFHLTWTNIWNLSTRWPWWGCQNEEFADWSKNFRHFSALSCPPLCLFCFFAWAGFTIWLLLLLLLHFSTLPVSTSLPVQYSVPCTW